MLAIWSVTSGNGTPGLGADTPSLSRSTVVSCDGLKVVTFLARETLQGATKAESRAQVDTLDTVLCTNVLIGRMFPVSPTSGYPLFSLSHFKLYKYYKFHGFYL